MSFAKKVPFFYGWVIAMCCFLLSFVTVGIAYNCWSLFTIPICKAIAITREQFSYIYTFILLGQMIVSFSLSNAIKHFGELRLMRISAVMLPLVMVIGAFVKTACALGVVGLGIGLMMPQMSFLMQSIVLSNWFVRLRGTVIGAVFTGSGLGGFVLFPLVERWISTFGWQHSLLILAIIMATVTLPVCYIFIVIKPDQIGQFPDGETTAPLQRDNAKRNDTESKEVVFLTAKVVLFILFVAGCYFIMAIGNTTTPHLCDSGYSSAAAAKIHAYCCGSVAVCRAFGGRICDKLGLNRASLLFILLLPTLPFGLLGAGSFHFAPVMIIIGFGMANAATAVFTPLLTVELFGQQNYSRVYSKVNAIGCLFGTVTPIIYGKIYTLNDSYSPAYRLFVFIFMIGSAALIVLMRKQKYAASNI